MSAPKLVVIGAARSGTTILNKVLMQSPDLHMYEHYEIFSNHYSSLDQKIFDFDISEFETDRFISDNQHNRICWKKYCQKAHEYYDGFKLLTWHLKNDVEEYLNECKVVLISRKNKLQVVASHKIASITDCWVGTDPFDGTIFLDPENTKSHVDRIVKAEKNLFLKSMGVPVRQYAYCMMVQLGQQLLEKMKPELRNQILSMIQEKLRSIYL